jgi:hypothetical protein
MWSLTSPRAKRISGSKNFRPSAKNDFFNTIRQKLPIEQAEFACLPTACLKKQVTALYPHLRWLLLPSAMLQS